MKKILVLNSVSPTGLNLFGSAYDVGPHVTGPDGIILRSFKLDTRNYPGVLAVARAGAGVNNITVQDATEKGLCVFNTPGANANAVAELVFVMLGMCARQVVPALEFVRGLTGTAAEMEAAMEKGKAQFSGFELAGKTIAVIGLGKIGVLVANAGVQRGMKVVAYEAFPTPANMHQLDQRVRVVLSIDAALKDADVLSVHVPLVEKTRGLIGADRIGLLKRACILVNFARGGIYDDTAVLGAIDAGHVRSYITDFPTPELLAHTNVICTPHLGASTAEAEENCATMAAQQLKFYLEFGVVTNSVNFPELQVFPGPKVRTRIAIVNSDVPNMIAAISGVFGRANINISGFENRSNGTIGYNLVDIQTRIPVEVADAIQVLPGVIKVRVLTFSE
jgi:D-3-phosphoglycerate dehydrogenase / 2-oxoglutarate reductase